MPRIEAEDLAIEFPLYHHNARSLKKRLFDGATRRVKQDAESRVVVAALSALSFAIGKGERVALVGSNGAGKTTLLRTIAGIYEPVAGRLLVEGEIGSLIDPGAGMNPLLTGRENIVLRGLYRGMKESEGRALANEIAEFSGLGEFIDLVPSCNGVLAALVVEFHRLVGNERDQPDCSPQKQCGRHGKHTEYGNRAGNFPLVELRNHRFEQVRHDTGDGEWDEDRLEEAEHLASQPD